MVHEDLTVRLNDGRALGYTEGGDPSGTPVFLFCGFPGAQPGGLLLEQPSQAAHVRLIIPDRPGLGLSDPQESRSITGWSDDILQLATALHVDRFAVLGTSEGSPYALACAFHLQTKVLAAGIVAGIAPLRPRRVRHALSPEQRRFLLCTARLPWLARRAMSALQANPSSWKTRVATRQCIADGSILGQPDFEESLQREAAAFFHQGVEGPAQELLLVAHDWSLPLPDIQTPVQLWYGREDTIAPPAMAEELADLLPHTLTRWFPNQGHLLLFSHAEEILTQLVSA